jgi:hypothetical protein
MRSRAYGVALGKAAVNPRRFLWGMVDRIWLAIMAYVPYTSELLGRPMTSMTLST